MAEKDRKPGQNGKGDKPKPLSISREEYNRRFDEIFKKHKGNTKK